jgi:hypothetical protein
MKYGVDWATNQALFRLNDVPFVAVLFYPIFGGVRAGYIASGYEVGTGCGIDWFPRL